MVEVFKTDVYEMADAKTILALLYEHFPDSRINFDLEDCDKVLRIEGKDIVASKVRTLITKQGFICTELE